MPRPKVPPNARQRVVSACRQCKASKRKCDGSLPCAYCFKRGIADVCEFLGSTRDSTGSLRRPRCLSSTSRSPIGSRMTSSRDQAGDLPTPTTDLAQTTDRAVEDPDATTATSDQPDVESPSTTRARMLGHNHGEQVYIGRYASLSFLQLMREAISRCIGPSEFSEYTNRDHMLEITPPDVHPCGDVLLSLTQKQQCIDNYFLATNGLCYVLTAKELEELLVCASNDMTNIPALGLLIISIGAQVGSIAGLAEAQYARIAFARAREIAFSDMLENLSLDFVRTFLLMAFYMLGACRRNAAYIYLGIAARAAHALGLHTAESYRNLSQDKRQARLRCWKSLVALDIAVSSILSRPAATSPQNSDENHVVRLVDTFDDESTTELEATYRLAHLVDSITKQFRGPDIVTTQAAQVHLQTLREWVAILPSRLRPFMVTAPSTTSTACSLLGSLHISCFYYFTVMLVTRPFLTMHVFEVLAEGNGTPMHGPSSNKSDDTSQLSAVCLTAAIYMAQICSDALHLTLLTENMCLIKAWIFAAGLVLGFWLFACNEHDEDTEQAFAACSQVLEKLATRSPQAAQYHDILSQLCSAVARHRRLRQTRKRHRSEGLLERIMNFQTNTDVESRYRSGSVREAACRQSTWTPARNTGIGHTASPDAQSWPNSTDNTFPNLNDFFLSSDESFSCDIQSFGTMPWEAC